jgi:hypothetical protein
MTAGLLNGGHVSFETREPGDRTYSKILFQKDCPVTHSPIPVQADIIE